jgi:hypothetical protein
MFYRVWMMGISAFVSQTELIEIPQIVKPSSIAEKWASYVLVGCKSPKDLKTIAIWAREAATSYSSLCETCRLIDVQPRHARDFCRILRIIVKSSMEPSFSTQWIHLLDVSDRRTLNSILGRAGFQQPTNGRLQLSIKSFLLRQQFIEQNNAGIKIVSDLLLPAESA